MRLLLISLGLILFTIVFYYLYALSVYSHLRISSAEARHRLEAGQFDLVLDVRTAVERSAFGYYPGSVHVPSADLAKVMSSRFPDKSIPILVYCNTGHRARLAVDQLHDLGYIGAVYISSSHLSLL
jgi:phage shock protein E